MFVLRAARLVKNIQHLSYTEHLKYLGSPSMQYRRVRADMVETFKILNNIEHVQHEHIFQKARTALRGYTKKIFKSIAGQTLENIASHNE